MTDSKTPRTDAAIDTSVRGWSYQPLFDESRKLERELTAEREKVERLEKDAARLDYLDANTRLILRSGKQRIRPLIDAAMKGEVDD